MSLATLVCVSLFTNCKKSSSVSTAVKAVSNPISATTRLAGYVKGTMTTGNTYNIYKDITVQPSDTLYVQAGATIKLHNNATIFISGTVICEGTQANPIVFAPDTTNPTPGLWGGFQCDSAKYVSFKWTKLNFTGGPDGSGSPRRTIRIKKPITFIFQDCWVLGGLDDGLRLENGVKFTILRNTFEGGCCSTDGEAINVKTGCTGTIAFNTIWSQAGSAIKIETSNTAKYPETKVDVYNNTVVNSGFRRGAGEPGCGIFCDAFGSGNFYNNMFVNCYNGINFGKSADTANIAYGNNYFYATVDSIRQFYYVAGSYGKKQSSDIVSLSVTSNAPNFTKFDTNITNTVDNNDEHLKTGSPAIGGGNTKYNADLGAYPTDGSGNKH